MEIKDFCEGQGTPGSIPYLSGRARLVGATFPISGVRLGISKDPSALLKESWR